METTHASPQITRHTKLKVTPKFISSNGKTTANTIPRTSDDTRCLLNYLITPFRLFTHNLVAEPISMSTPQMNYVNENSQNNRKEQRQGNNNYKWQFILSYLQAYM